VAEITELPEADSWKEPAHPSAQLVARESQAALDRLLQLLDSIDMKASFLAAGGFVLMAGFMTAIATHPPTNARLQDAVAVALLLDLAALAPVLFVWWPRPVDVPPHPRGLREHHFYDQEAKVLLAISDRIASTYDETKNVELRKTTGVKVAMVSLYAATIISVAVAALDLILGAPH
jgi:hypothetical protein